MHDESNSYALASLTMQAILPLKIMEYRQKGGPTDLDWEFAKINFDNMMAAKMDGNKEVWAGGAGVVVYIPGISGKEMKVVIMTLAVLAFLPGGVEFCGVRYFGNESDRVEYENLQKMHATKTPEPV